MITEVTEEESAKSSNISLTPEELTVLSEIDSRLFGFLKLKQPENAKKKALVSKAVAFLEKVLISHNEDKENDLSSSNKQDVDKISEKMAAISTTEPEQKTETDSPEEMEIDPSPKESEESEEEMNIKIYCKLGHFNLLLENYSKALSAYQKYYTMKEDHWKNAPFMYGLGLVYFHYNAYHWMLVTSVKPSM